MLIAVYFITYHVGKHFQERMKKLDRTLNRRILEKGVRKICLVCIADVYALVHIVVLSTVFYHGDYFHIL